MLRKHYGTLLSHYRTLRSITEHYAALRDVMMKHYGSVTGRNRTTVEALQSVVEHYEMLWSIVECYRMLREHYGAIMECYGTIRENIIFAHPKFNFIYH